ncbi:MAG TPA: hypothetical protein VEB64_10025 [Azospirillaceae bacterium]|nr:hypothetical protein [Azospirillaceae bacterium]
MTKADAHNPAVAARADRIARRELGRCLADCTANERRLALAAGEAECRADDCLAALAGQIAAEACFH